LIALKASLLILMIPLAVATLLVGSFGLTSTIFGRSFSSKCVSIISPFFGGL